MSSSLAWLTKSNWPNNLVLKKTKTEKTSETPMIIAFIFKLKIGIADQLKTSYFPGAALY